MDRTGWRRITPAGFAMVALGAGLWGTDALFRRGLAQDFPASVVVLAEHAILVVLTLPLLVRALRRLPTFRPVDWVAVVLVGVGASATATFLFTASFRYGDPTTTLLLQKLQPVFAVIGARLVLGERLLPRYVLYFVLAVSGAYLVSVPDPWSANPSQLAPALLAVAAAALWGMGTVLGRHLSARVPFAELTSLRFAVGLPATLLLAFVDLAGEPWPVPSGSDVTALVLLALVPGLIALMVYYRGLTATPASAATLAELAFPLTALVVNYLAFDTVLTTWQWLGLLVLAGTVTVMGVAARRGPPGLGVRRIDHRPEPALGNAGI